MQDRHLPVVTCQWLSFCVKFLQTIFQDTLIIVAASHEWAIAIGTYRTLGELGAVRTRRKSATAALQPTRDSIAHGLLRDFQPNREIERCAQPLQDSVEAFRLRR